MTAIGRLIARAVLLTAMALYAYPLLAQQQFEFFQGSDLPGGDYDVVRNVTAQACASACNKASQCRAFTYNIAKSVCFLKSQSSRPKAFAGALSGLKGAQQAGPNFEIFADTELPGGDLAAYRDASAEQCQAACAQNAQFQSFTQNVANSVCFLK